MKKIVQILAVCLLLCGTFCSISCSKSQLRREKIQENEEASLQSNGVPPRSYGFQSYRELANVFQSGTKEYQQVFNERMEENENIEDLYQYLSSSKGNLYVPYVSGTIMPFYERSGFSNITLFEQELYGEPWIWYFGKVGENMVTVQTMYYGYMEKADELSRTSSCSEFLKILSPTAPNIDNYTQFKFYQNVFEKTIHIGNEDRICLIAEVVDSSKIYLEFVFDDLFVILYGQKTDVETLIGNGLSFLPYN